jgi:GNAT superfamily N-acetyltransferase
MQIRRLRPDEWSALRDLRLRSLTADPDAFGSTFERERGFSDAEWQDRARSTDGVIVVAESDGGLVGIAMGAPLRERPDDTGVFAMWVAPEARGLGTGGQLLDSIVAWARSAGKPSLELGVVTGNAAAIALYDGRGFVDTGERRPLREGSALMMQTMVAPVPTDGCYTGVRWRAGCRNLT